MDNPHDKRKGERVSLKGQTGTVRYIGSVADKQGEWLGVEWDDTTRGKHNGTHDGVKYFECRSKSPTAASFLRPHQPWDPPRTFYQALREKYMPEFHENDAEIVYFSGKQAEEIGFEKFHQRQAKLQGIRVLVLDHMQIQYRTHEAREEEGLVKDLCSDITDLDLSDNLLETFEQLHRLARFFPKLRTLTLDGNRFVVNARLPLYVQTLNLARTLADETHLNYLLGSFEGLKTLNLAGNEYCGPFKLQLPTSVETVDLSDNQFTALSDLVGLDGKDSALNSLILKRNRISSIYGNKSASDLSLSITELDLSYNLISTFDFFNDINQASLPNLKHLRVTGNPVYTSLLSAEGRALTTEDGYMLTIARLPQLESLNYSKITEKERLNAETYYLSQIALELSRALEGDESSILARHPRYRDLCDEYGTPTLQRTPVKRDVDPNTLAAQLVTVTFTLAPSLLPGYSPRTWTEEFPKSLNIYAVLGLVAKKLGVFPLDLRLVLETEERDPVGSRRGVGAEVLGVKEWDSSDEEDEDLGKEEWVRRRLELVAGTRAMGTFVEGRHAGVLVELRDEVA